MKLHWGMYNLHPLLKEPFKGDLGDIYIYISTFMYAHPYAVSTLSFDHAAVGAGSAASDGFQ